MAKFTSKKEAPFAASGINRAWKPANPVSVTTSEATTEVVEMLSSAGGCVEVPTGSSITTLTFYALTDPDGTFLPLYDVDGAAVAVTVAGGQIHPLPDEVYNVPYFKMVGDAAGDVNVFLKG